MTPGEQPQEPLVVDSSTLPKQPFISWVDQYPADMRDRILAMLRNDLDDFDNLGPSPSRE